MTRLGSTLVELIVVLALMGVISLVVTLSLRDPRRANGPDSRMLEARREALRSRRPVTVAVETNGPGR